MRSLLKNSILVVLTISTLGCRKDTPIVEIPDNTDTSCNEDWCYDIPPEPGLGYQYIIEGFQYTMPCFNPLNNNEFVYIRSDGGINTELVKYSISTKQETVLCNSLFITEQPHWGKLGWISFASGKKIWKINQDGTQLTQLTFGIDDTAPHFNYNGDRIIYMRLKHYTNWTYQQNPELYKEDKMMVIDLDGNILDSVMVKRLNADYIGIFSYQIWGVAAFDIDAVYFYGGMEETNTYGIHQLSFQDSLITPVVMLSDPGVDGSHLMDFDQSGKFVYCTRQYDGLYRFDMQSGENIKIRLGCDTRFYQDISVSGDGTKLLVERVNRELLNCCEIDEQREIWLLDLEDGCEMIQVLGE